MVNLYARSSTFCTSAALVFGILASTSGWCAGVCDVPSFHAAPVVPVGISPLQVVMDDFNGDGINDLATANLSGSVSIELGNGDGTFAQAAGSPISTANAGGLAVGDFNDDGKLDLFVALIYSNQLLVLTGDGTGGFMAGTPFIAGPSSSTPAHVVVGYFNADSFLDVAVALNGSYQSGGVAVFLGDGAGNFTAAPGSPMIMSGSEMLGIVAGQLSGSSATDLAVVDAHHDTVTILQGGGDGSFTDVADITVVADASARPFEITTADVNRDGLDDLLVANNVQRANGDLISPYNNVAVLLQQINHTFAAPVFVEANGDVDSVASADFNGDRRPDFVVANAAFSFGATVRFGDGTANFNGGGPTFYGAAGSPYNVATGILNAGYGPGFVVVNQPSNTLSVYLNDCDAIFRANFDGP